MIEKGCSVQAMFRNSASPVIPLYKAECLCVRSDQPRRGLSVVEEVEGLVGGGTSDWRWCNTIKVVR